MKAKKTVAFPENILKIPVRYGRPNTPDDEPWIEALNKSSKYHRDAPTVFPTVSDVPDWLERFKLLHNNDPHSALHYVTPAEAFAGKMEVILNQRRNNLIAANKMRLEAFRSSRLEVEIR
ncbi:MAG: integrase core domain-containing protein [Smithella sp.]